MKQFVVALMVILGALLLVAAPVQAVKAFVPKKQSAPVKKTVVRSTGGIPSVARLRGDRRAILLSFSHFNGIDSAEYSLTYTNNGKAEGAGGTIRASNNPSSVRELAFGTCSTGVCTYHTGIRDAKLTIIVKYTNGTTKTKIYKIKI